MINKFEKGSSTYICEDCGKRTRDTGIGEKEVGLCKKCYEEAEKYNAYVDGELPEELNG